MTATTRGVGVGDNDRRYKTCLEQNLERIARYCWRPKEGEFIQTGLVEFMNMAVDDFAKDSGDDYHDSMLDLTKTMLFVVVRMFNNLYTSKVVH